MSYAGTLLTRRFVTYVFRGLAYALLAWALSERFNRDPRRPLLFVILLLLLATSYGLHRLSGRRFLPVKAAFAVCMILSLALNYFYPLMASHNGLVGLWLFALAIAPFFPVRPPLGPWWPAAKRTIRMFRGDSREDDAEHAAKILASFRQANTPQK
jgi:hypothetical protein